MMFQVNYVNLEVTNDKSQNSQKLHKMSFQGILVIISFYLKMYPIDLEPHLVKFDFCKP